MKSFIDTFATLYGALIEDILSVYPSFREELERDHNRLLDAMRHEGIGFITITHGHMDSVLLATLSEEKFSAEVARSVRRMCRRGPNDCRPRYLHCLWSRLLSADGTLLEEPDVLSIAFLRQWFNLAKKLEIAVSDDKVESEIANFVRTNASNPRPHDETWDADDPTWTKVFGHPLRADDQPTELDLFADYGEVDSWDLGPRWDDFRRFCCNAVARLGTFDFWSITPKHGPGVVAEGLRTSKYEFPLWPHKLQSIFPWDYFATPDFGDYRRETGTEPAPTEIPCVMYAVPKTAKGPRLIAAEPIAHQWIQGGIQRWFEDRIRQSSFRKHIDFTDQGESRRLALEASRSGELATVDLSSASDRVSCRLVHYIFQVNPDLLDALHACRTRFISIGPNASRLRESLEIIRLRMFAPMGSAVCFPVQTFVFTLIALYAVRLTRGTSHDVLLSGGVDGVRVFGDDIIVPVDVYPVLCKLLVSLGLKVNQGKSFHTGLFREACGMDAYDGVDVTPVKVKKLYSGSDPTTLQSVVESSNNLFVRGFWRTADALLKTIPAAERKLLAVGAPVGGAVSLYSFMGSKPAEETRWDNDYHCEYTRPLGLRSKPIVVRGGGQADLMQFFSEFPEEGHTPEFYSGGRVTKVKSSKSRVRQGVQHTPR